MIIKGFDKKAHLKLITQDRVVRRAFFDSIALISNRIQQRGEKTDGSQIGKYSTKTLNFKAITSGFYKIGSKKQILSRYKSHGDIDEFYGYDDFRKALGRQVQFIDLTLTGEMIDGLTLIKQGKDWVIGFISKASADKAQWNEAKFGTVFHLSENEIDLVISALEISIDEAIRSQNSGN